jgi:DNA-binding MarR family transcriptional regulator
MDKKGVETKNLDRVMGIDRIVHESARLLILAYLSFLDSADFIFLMNQTGLTRGNLSSHLVKLESPGYIEVKKEFVGRVPRTLLRITKKGKSALLEYKKEMKTVLQYLI